VNGWTARVLIALSIGLGACGAVDPEVGEDVDAAQAAGGTTACVDQDSDLESGVTWMMLQEQVLAKRCGCHTTPGGLGVTVTGLDLATRDGALKGGRNTPDAIVPSDPCASVLLAKVAARPPFGSRMPLNGVPLAEAERQLIVDWIAEGARP
jgi:hypothetical protein